MLENELKIANFYHHSNLHDLALYILLRQSYYYQYQRQNRAIYDHVIF